MNFEMLNYEVLEWAKQRGFLRPTNYKTQLLKTVEEVGELVKAVLENNDAETIDALGDIVVTLIIFAEMKDLRLIDCLDAAYEEIKNRKGSVKNGSFIKE
jgi:NTP pyrophosphatase (non-canonical NTP hydrolase)